MDSYGNLAQEREVHSFAVHQLDSVECICTGELC